MPETDTIERTSTRRLQVANLAPGDLGSGFARVPMKVMQALGLKEGDIIEIVGKRTTTARVLRPYDEDEALEIIRLDGLQRTNARVGSGDYVEVRKAKSKPATKVVFAPAQDNVREHPPAHQRASLCAARNSPDRGERFAQGHRSH